MAYIAPSTISTGDLITAAKWNSDVSANPIAIYAGAMSVASQAVGDILYASSTTQFARVAAVAAGQVLASAGTGTVPAYSATPALTSVDMGGTTVYGSRAITVDTGGVLNVVLSSSAGDDFTVDTTKLVVSGDSGAVGIGTAAPVSLLDVRGPTGTGATPAGLLTLATAELTVVDNDQLGRINFQAPLESSGSDAILAAASIYAEATATFSATVNSTDLIFATATDGAVVEHLRLDSRGTMRYGYEGTGKGTFQNESWGTVVGNNSYYNGSAWVAVATGVSSNMKQDSAANFLFTSAPSVSAGAGTTDVTNVTILANGKVGIGNSTPDASRLDLGLITDSDATLSGTVTDYQLNIGSATTSGEYGHAICFSDGSTVSAAINGYDRGSSGGMALRFATMNTSGAFADRLTIDHNGSVGIGVAAPARRLSVHQPDASWAVVQITNNGTGVTDTDGFQLQEVGASAYVYNYEAGAIYFGTSAAHRMDIAASGAVNVVGAFSKGSGSFKIDHPLPALNETHNLVHSFIEGPQADLIYRGTATLDAGTATIDLDEASGMTTGTWELLCRDAQCYTTNETGWHNVRGSVAGSTLTIECEEVCDDTISWMVVAERQDQHMQDSNTDWTDENGRPIIEPLKTSSPAPAGAPAE